MTDKCVIRKMYTKINTNFPWVVTSRPYRREDSQIFTSWDEAVEYVKKRLARAAQGR